MTDTVARDAESLHRALDAHSGDVNVVLSRETAELLARVVDARARGEQVIFARGDTEVTPNEAARLVGMSRPQVRKLMESGKLEYRKVGTHHRVTLESIQTFLDHERPRRRKALKDLAALQNELGLDE